MTGAMFSGFFGTRVTVAMSFRYTGIFSVEGTLPEADPVVLAPAVTAGSTQASTTWLISSIEENSPTPLITYLVPISTSDPPEILRLYSLIREATAFWVRL